MRVLQDALDPAGPQAQHIHLVWDVFLWVSVAVYAIVLGFVIAALVRKGPGERGTPEAKRAGWVIVAGAAITTVVLLVLTVVSAVQGHAIAALRGGDRLKIRVTGHQWWWEVTYDHTVASQQVTTANEIHIPVGRRVQFHLTSGDVIHSFWVPNLHGKTDLLPGEVTTEWLRADRPGKYRGQCAEFCGVQHAHMAFLVIAEPQAEFDRWYAQQLQPAREPQSDMQRRGRDLFVTQACVMCHTVRGTIAGARYGPDLTHIASRQTIAAGTLPFTRGHLAGWISDPQSAKPGNNMPAVSLKPDELQAIVSYLETLQ